MQLYATHVGSFPLEHSRANLERVISDLARVGLDYVGYPQLRDFVGMYLEPLVSCGALRPAAAGFALLDRRALLDACGERPPPVEEAVALREAADRGVVRGRLKASVTGPFTLASQIYLGGQPSLSASALRDRGVVEALAELVRGYLRGLEELRYDVVVLDEPVLSVIVGRRVLFGYAGEDLVDVLSAAVDGAKFEHVGVHVCGRLSPLLARTLLSLEVDVLDHEHKDIPENLGTYSREDLESHGKFLSLGVVSSKSPRVESVAEVREAIAEGLRLFGDRLLFVKPDCGFRGLRVPGREEEMYSAALEKLRRLVAALRSLS